MRTLIVLASPPLPEGGAPGKHAIALIRGLRAHGVDVQAIAAEQYFTGAPPADLAVEILAPHGRRPSHVDRILRPGRALIDTPFAERVREAARNADVVHLEQVDMSWLDRGASAPSLVHVHHRVRLDRPVGLPWRSEGRWVIERDLIERSAIRRHRFLLASSPVVEATLAGQAPRARVARAPLALDGTLYPAAPLEGPPTAGIIGTAHWPPTREAMTQLVERVWPLILQRVPSARLLVAGRGTEMLRGGRGVEILGEVASAVEFMHRLTVLVFPLSRGSGVKVKTLESIACGLPVVTTPAGAEGIAASDGIIVEEDDERLAEAAARLLLNPGDARRRGEAARATFTATHAPIPATAPVVAFYKEMLARS